MDRYMTLVSNASMDLYPNNKRSSFRTRLPYLHDFSEGAWFVGLTELTYTKSWFNVADGHHLSPAYADDFQTVPLLASAVKTPIQPGFYESTASLVTHVNELMAKWNIRGIKQIPVLEVKSNQKVAHKVYGKDHLNKEFGAQFDKRLNQLLGIYENRPAFLDQGMTSLFIYCNIIQPQVVGDSLEPLLRTVGVNSDAPFGQNVTETFESPYYLPLSSKVFQEIQIDIRSDTGDAPAFQFGRVALTLHFVQE